MEDQTRLISRFFYYIYRKAYFNKPVYQNCPHAWVDILLNCFHEISRWSFLRLPESKSSTISDIHIEERCRISRALQHMRGLSLAQISSE